MTTPHAKTAEEVASPPKTHAEVAKKLWKRLLDADVDACNPDCDDQTRGPVAILTTALREAKNEGIAIGTAVKPEKGFIMDDDGNVRRALGTLPISADGSVLAPGAIVWPHGDVFIDDDEAGGTVIWSVRDNNCGDVLDETEWEAAKCYSSREAALHAKDAHAVEKGAANGK